jgi:osmotically-inducible protein OsmY
MITTSNDATLQTAVMGELTWDSTVNATSIGVTVEEGVVTLTGTVVSFAERIAAQEAAHRVAGVLDVANEIEVKIKGTGWPSDADVAQAVRHALQNALPHTSGMLQTTVSDGWVHLEGAVERWIQREEAELAIRHLAGVRGVTNGIKVKAFAVQPELIREAITDVLERRADREAHRIEIEVHDGMVTLKGTVHSWMERRAVVGAVGHQLGVEAVDDRLVVEPTI